MKKTIYFISILIITLSCKEKKTEPKNIKNKITKSDTVFKTKEDSVIENNSDCVFEDDYKKVTGEWLNELEIKKYVWDSKTNKAIVTYNGDTLTVYSGGCNHFINAVEIKTDIYPNKELDSTLFRKINDIACKFNFTNYCEKLKKGQFKKINNSDSSFYLEFEDDDSEDNLYFERITILEKGNSTIINISEYYN